MFLGKGKKRTSITESNQCLTVSDVKIRIVDRNADRLIAWASCVVNNALFLNNIAVKRSLEGKLILSFPVRNNGNTKYFHFHPISQEAGAVLENAIIDKLGFGKKAINGNR